jgi:hypothetical protein
MPFVGSAASSPSASVCFVFVFLCFRAKPVFLLFYYYVLCNRIDALSVSYHPVSKRSGVEIQDPGPVCAIKDRPGMWLSVCGFFVAFASISIPVVWVPI